MGVFCLLEGMKRTSIEAVNYAKVREVIQRPYENLSLFHSRLTNAIHKQSRVDPDKPSGEIVVARHFVDQSVSNTRRKLQRLALGLQTPLNELTGVAFSVFYNRDQVEENKEKRRAKLLAATLQGADPL